MTLCGNAPPRPEAPRLPWTSLVMRSSLCSESYQIPTPSSAAGTDGAPGGTVGGGGRERPGASGADAALAAQDGGDLLGHAHGEPLLLAGALEEQQGGHGLAVDLPRLEDRHDLGREMLELGRASLLGVEGGEVERDERRVVPHPA